MRFLVSSLLSPLSCSIFGRVAAKNTQGGIRTHTRPGLSRTARPVGVPGREGGSRGTLREGGFEPPPPDSKSGSLPVSRFPSRSGIGDSNPGRLVGSQESCHWTNPAEFPKAEGEGVEPSRLIARPSSSRVPSPIGLPFR